MTKDLTLSQQVESFFDTLDSDDENDSSPEGRHELRKIQKMVSVIVDDVITSRETLTDNKLRAIEKLVGEMPEVIKDFLNDRYTRDVIRAVPGYVSRTMKLSRLEGSGVPSKTTNTYLREATRTYIYGLPQASIALCRAAMEQALKENLGHQGVRTRMDMNQLLDEAEGGQIVDGSIRRMAQQIAKAANDVLHEKPADLPKAYEVLLMLRGVLQHLYAQ